MLLSKLRADSFQRTRERRVPGALGVEEAEHDLEIFVQCAPRIDGRAARHKAVIGAQYLLALPVLAHGVTLGIREFASSAASNSLIFAIP
jgi:hypothetical protein